MRGKVRNGCFRNSRVLCAKGFHAGSYARNFKKIQGPFHKIANSFLLPSFLFFSPLIAHGCQRWARGTRRSSCGAAGRRDTAAWRPAGGAARRARRDAAACGWRGGSAGRGGAAASGRRGAVGSAGRGGLRVARRVSRTRRPAGGAARQARRDAAACEWRGGLRAARRGDLRVRPSRAAAMHSAGVGRGRRLGRHGRRPCLAHGRGSDGARVRVLRGAVTRPRLGLSCTARSGTGVVPVRGATVGGGARRSRQQAVTPCVARPAAVRGCARGGCGDAVRGVAGDRRRDAVRQRGSGALSMPCSVVVVGSTAVRWRGRWPVVRRRAAAWPSSQCDAVRRRVSDPCLHCRVRLCHGGCRKTPIG